jgi:SAM-dependent methyltransferase
MSEHPAGFFEGTEMPTAGWWEALWPDPAGVLAAVGVAASVEAIDLCSGDGWFTLWIAKVARRVTAIDIDPTLIEVARRRLAEGGATNCDLVIGDACEVARLAPRPADIVFMANAFHGVPDPRRLAGAVRDALVPGGRFVVVNWHARRREETVVLGEPRGPRTELRLSPERAVAAIVPSGLALVRLIEVPPYHYAAVFERPPGA